MPQLAPLKIDPQTDVLTLADGKQRMANFQNLMSNFYKNGPGTVPRGVYIPMDDLAEIAKLQKDVTSITDAVTGKVIPIEIIGERAYFTFPLKELEVLNMEAADYPVDLILVPVYRIPSKTANDDPAALEAPIDTLPITYDLVAPVPYKAKPTDTNIDERYSIYDITQPCPKLCDTDNTLYY